MGLQIATVIGLILLFGATGGWAAYYFGPPNGFRQEDQRVTQLSIAHAVVGICGAVVAVAASIKLFDLDIDTYVKQAKTTLTLPLSVSAISVLGGYSALRMIPLLVDEGLRRLSKKFGEFEQENRERNMELEKKNKRYAAKFALDEARPKHALKLATEMLDTNPDDETAMSLKAAALKRLGRFGEAVNSATKLIELVGSRKVEHAWTYYYNLACYMVLQQHSTSGAVTDLKEVLEQLEQAKELVDREETLETFLRLLDTDDDLAAIRDDSEFKKFKRAIEG